MTVSPYRPVEGSSLAQVRASGPKGKHVTLGTLVLALVLAGAGPSDSTEAGFESPAVACPGSRARPIRSLSLEEMVSELERGCLALDDVRFMPAQDTLASVSPSEFAQVARALGLSRGAYRVAVPPESQPGFGPDTLQARRRGMRLRDELIHYGASATRLVEDLGWPMLPPVPAGTATPLLMRVPDPS